MSHGEKVTIVIIYIVLLIVSIPLYVAVWRLGRDINAIIAGGKPNESGSTYRNSRSLSRHGNAGAPRGGTRTDIAESASHENP